MLSRSVFILICLIFGFGNSIAQYNYEKGFKHQLSFIEDNDYLVLKGTDRYYTNGAYFQFSTLRRSKENKVIKHINEWEIGQQIYSAHKRQVNLVKELDRPISGYLYGKFSKLKFKTGNQLWKYGISVGTIGKSSYAKEINHFIQKMTNVNTDRWGWIYNYQLKDEVGANLHGTYAFSALKDYVNFFQITPETNMTLGTSLMNIRQSVLFQFGGFNPMHESGFWNSKLSERVLPGNRKTEFFLFCQPEIVYQAYNATIQGGMFRKDKGTIIASPKSFVFYNTLGLMYTSRLWSASFQYVSESKAVKTQQDAHSYGRVKFSYRFK